MKALRLQRGMKNLATAIIEVMNETDAGQILDREIFDAMVTEGNELLPHVLVLSGGQMQKATTKLNAYKAPTILKRKLRRLSTQSIFGSKTAVALFVPS